MNQRQAVALGQGDDLKEAGLVSQLIKRCPDPADDV